MNAALDTRTDIDELQVRVPEPALSRLDHRLRQAGEDGEVWEVSARYGARPELVEALLDYHGGAFDFRKVEQRLNELPLYGARRRGRVLAFLHARSPRPDARPLLWLHGYSSSLFEVEGLLAELTTPRQPSEPAFHVVAPSLPGHGLSDTVAGAGPGATADELGRLMRELGYAGYCVHGSDGGARLGLDLARASGSNVTSLHVTSLGIMPSEDPLELAALDAADKSRLASQRELFECWQWAAPSSPVERLAFAAAQLSDLEPDELTGLRDALLTGLTLSLLGGDNHTQQRLAAARWAPPGPSHVPTCICSFPLAPPTLHAPTARAHARLVWHEHERGGELAALEQPQLLLASLRRFIAAT